MYGTRGVAERAGGVMVTRTDIDRLKIFYNVETDVELIGAMEHHIEQLQAKLNRLSPSEPAIRLVRS